MMDTDRRIDWLVVFTAFMCHCMTHGIVYSYGILFVSLKEAFHGTKSELGWIVSLTTGCLYLSGPIASILVNRFGNRTVATVGAVISSFAYILTIFSTSLYFMYFSLGLLSGVGYGLIFIPSVVDVTKRFKKHRALACGTAVSGAGFGAFVISPLIKILLDTYSWRGTLLIQAGILLNIIPCAMTFTGRSTNTTSNNKKMLHDSEKGNYKQVATELTEIESVKWHEPKKDLPDYNVVCTGNDGSTDIDEKYYLQTSEKFNVGNDECKPVDNGIDLSVNKTLTTDIDMVKPLFKNNGDISHTSELNTFTGNYDPLSQINKDKTNEIKNGLVGDKSKLVTEHKDVKTVTYSCEHLKSGEMKPNEKASVEALTNEESKYKTMISRFYSHLKFFCLLKRKDMLLFYISQVLFISGLYLPFVFIPEMAISYGISRQSAAWIISTIGISTVFGRITLGYLSDRKFMNRVWLYKIALLVAGVITAIVPVLTTFHVLVISAVIFGLSTAVLLSQTSVVLVEIVGLESMSDAMGLSNMFCGFGAIVGPPLLGLMYDKTGSYLVPFLVAGLGMVLGSVLQCLMVLVPHHTYT